MKVRNRRTRLLFNRFCATGEGGGVDPTCGKDDAGQASAHHLGVKSVVDGVKTAWGYHGEVQVLDQEGTEFERGGVKWKEGGNCILATGKVTIFSKSAGEQMGAVRHLAAHEFMHGAFELVHEKLREEREKSFAEEAPTKTGSKQKMDGTIYPEYVHEFPTYSRLEKYMTGDNFDKLKSDDGISDYSKAYWKDYSNGKCPFHIAVHETLAEIAGMQQRSGEIPGDTTKLWKDLYKAVRDEYRVLTGQQKTRKGVGLTKNASLFADHNLYLDADYKPTTPDKAKYLRWWKKDGSNGWATRSDVVENILAINPFQSEAQRRACYAADDPNWDCKEWEAATPKGKKLPKYKKGKTRNASLKPRQYDPTQTISLRRGLVTDLKLRFARLRAAIFKLVVTGDAFGLEERAHTANSFCPTGQGGGVDPSCSPSHSLPYGGKGGLRGGTGNTSTPEFKKWFGKSKVVDKHGQPTENAEIEGIAESGSGTPKVVYHGSPRGEITEFRKDMIAHEDSLHFGPGFYFTEDVAAAEGFAKGGHSDKAIGDNPTVMRFYLRSEKPFDADKDTIDPSQLPKADRDVVRSALVQKAFADEGRSEAVAVGRSFDNGEIKMTYRELVGDKGIGGYGVSKTGVAEHLKSIGHDSITTQAPDVGERGSNRYWIVFEPTQIKSTKNAGTFDPSSPNVLNKELDATEVMLENFGTMDWETRSKLLQPLVDNKKEWEFSTSAERVKEFKGWLDKQVGDTIHDESVWEKYAQAGFRKGAGRAFDDTKKARKEKPHTAETPTKLAFYEGTKEQFLKTSFAQPVAKEKVELLAQRSFDDLKNVTSDMATRMGRTLADGLVQGKSPREIGRDLSDDLDLAQGRATTIARTEIIRAHAEGQLQALEDLGVSEVGVEVEWSTAGDGLVCADCADMEGQVVSIEDAQGMIPMHPNCRCAYIPALPEWARNKRFTRNAFQCSKSDEVLNHLCLADNALLYANAFCPTGPGGGVDATCGKGSSTHGTKEEMAAAMKIAQAKIKSAPVPTQDKVEKMRAALALAREGKGRPGGDARGNSTDRRRRAEKLFEEFGGKEKGYIVCPWTGIKMHYSNDPALNPHGYPKFEQGKIFTACQGGSYSMSNLLPESFTANRQRNDTRIRSENSKGC